MSGAALELRTDLGNARRLVARHGNDIRYCPALGWLVWDGRRWARDEDGGAMRRMKSTVRSIFDEAKNAATQEEAEALGKWAARSQAAPRLAAALELAKTEEEVVVRASDLDSDKWSINVLNGTIDLRSGALREHRREDLITKIAPVEFDPAAKAPRWERFLEEVQPDPEIRDFLRRLAGASLSAERRDHVLPVLWGTGGNGKSVFTNTWQGILGEYARKAGAELLLDRDGRGPTNDLAALVGARLVLVSEPEAGARLAESLVKDLTGGDPITARYLYCEFFTFVPGFLPVLVTNHRPHVRGTDFGIWRRVRLVPWSVTVSAVKVEDPDLPNVLWSEAPGILNWAIAGCLEWQDGGLKAPAAVLAATEAYRDEEDVLAPFLESECVLGSDRTTNSGELWAAYRRFTEATGDRPLSRRSFGDRLLERGLQPGKSGKGGSRVWFGISLAGAAGASTPTSVKPSREGEGGEFSESDAPRARHAPTPLLDLCPNCAAPKGSRHYHSCPRNTAEAPA